MDLNDLQKAILTGQIDESSVRVVRRDGKIVDYLLDDETASTSEHVENMTLMDALREVFDLPQKLNR